MRRTDRAISEAESLDLLTRAEYGVISTVDGDGKPYGVPLNFCFMDSGIYFHSAIEGHKIENIRQNRHVSFCVVGSTEVLPAKFGTKYRSVILFGEIEEVFGTHKQIALEGLVRKYAPQFVEEGIRYIASEIDNTRVFRINITKLTGKGRIE